MGQAEGEPPLSKKHGQRHKRPKKPRPLACPRCHTPADGSPAAILGALAIILNDCQSAGIRVRLAHGFAETSSGYVLRAGGGRWKAWVPDYGEPAGPDWGKPDTD